MFLSHGDLTALVVNDVREELRRAPKRDHVLGEEFRRAVQLHLRRDVRARGAPSTATGLAVLAAEPVPWPRVAGPVTLTPALPRSAPA